MKNLEIFAITCERVIYLTFQHKEVFVKQSVKILKSLKTKLSSIVFCVCFIIFVIVGYLSYNLAKSGMTEAGMGQISDTLEGGFSVIENYYKRVTANEITFEQALTEIRLLLCGRAKEIWLKSEGDADIRELMGLIGLAEPAQFTIQNNEVFYNRNKIGKYDNAKKLYIITETGALDLIMSKHDNLKLTEQQKIANSKFAFKVIYDFTKAAIKIRASGYVWIINGNPNDRFNGQAYEIAHPQIGNVNVWGAKNYLGEFVGKNIGSLNGKIDTAAPGEIVRYDYLWKNPTDPSARNKIVLMKYFKPWNWVVCSGLYEDEFYSYLDKIRITLIIGTILAGALSFLITFFAVIRIVRAIHQITNLAVEISRGNFELQETKIERKDELGILAHSINQNIRNLRNIGEAISRISQGDLTIEIKSVSDADGLSRSLNPMIDSLNLLIGEVKNSASQVNSGAEQISDGSQSLSQGSSEQASALSEIAATANEVNAQAKLNSDNSRQASKLAEETMEAAVRGDSEMKELLNSMKDINESAKEIQKIVKVIDDIAFQINLLALNANVEAARAGKYGKGFAVVADEVRNLAMKSANSVKETTEMVEKSIKSVQAGNNFVVRVNENLKTILDKSGKSLELTNEVMIASENQAHAIEEINKGLDQIEQITQAATANAEESAATAEELSAQSNTLLDLISRFKLKEQRKALP